MTRNREEADRMVETVRRHVSGEPDPIQQNIERERVAYNKKGGADMYEVRWTETNGVDGMEEYVDENIAIERFDDIKDFQAMGHIDVDSVGVYYIDGDGAEIELLVWAR